LRVQLNLPMHYFNPVTLQRFLARLGDEFPGETARLPTLVISQATLPAEPKVLVLPGQ